MKSSGLQVFAIFATLALAVAERNVTSPLPFSNQNVSQLCLDGNPMLKNCTGKEIAGGRCNLNGCNHKSLFSPFLPMDIVAGVVIMVGCVFAVAGGIGGGGLFVPLLMLLQSFDIHEAVPLSKVMIFAAAIVSFTSNVRKRNPHADRPLIDLDCAIFLVPMTLAGTVLGTTMHIVTPAWLIGFLLIIVLGATTHRTVQKGMKTFKTERTDAVPMTKKATVRDLSPTPHHDGPSTPTSTHTHPRTPTHQSPPTLIDIYVCIHTFLFSLKSISTSTFEGSNNVELLAVGHSAMDSDTDTEWSEDEEDKVDAGEMEKRKMIREIQEEEKKFNFKKFFAMWGIWAVLGASAIIRGGHGFSLLGIDPCSENGWVFYAFSIVPILFCITVCMVHGRHLARTYEKKQQIGYPFAAGDFKWTRKSTLIYPWVAMVGGIFAGLLGLGGGMVIGPILLELGGHPQVSSAVSAFTILFTASATTFQFLLLGVLEYDYALYYSIICAIAAVIGQKAVGAIIKKYKKVSIIVFCLAGVMGVSSLLIGGLDIYQTIDDFKNNRSMGFQVEKLCLH